MINKVSKRINELIESQQRQIETPTHKLRSNLQRNSNNTPSASKRSDRLNMSDNHFINHSPTQIKNKNNAEYLQIQDPLNRTRSIYSDHKIVKQFGALIQHYKAEIMNLIQPLIDQMEDKLIDKITKLQRMIIYTSNQNQFIQQEQYGKQFTLAPHPNFQRKQSFSQQQIRQSIQKLVIKAQTIQTALEFNSKSISQRLDSIQLKYQSKIEENYHKGSIRSQCSCQSFIQKILATETLLSQQIKFMKHQIDKLKQKEKDKEKDRK